tara:strand:- start:313 stop:993 length:681 start_codon:yes stop_codon:yes gene_type:complete
MAFDLSQYETVDSRIHKFWAEHKDDGRLETRLVEVVRDDTGRPLQYVMEAQVWIGDRLIANGFAEEVVGGSPVNKTAALENCETSSLGRALANAGYSKEKFRASMSEMTKAERLTGTPDDDPFYKPRPQVETFPNGQPVPTVMTNERGGLENGASTAQKGKIRGMAKDMGITTREEFMGLVNACLMAANQGTVTNLDDLTKRAASQVIEQMNSSTTVEAFTQEVQA